VRRLAAGQVHQPDRGVAVSAGRGFVPLLVTRAVFVVIAKPWRNVLTRHRDADSAATDVLSN